MLKREDIRINNPRGAKEVGRILAQTCIESGAKAVLARKQSKSTNLKSSEEERLAALFYNLSLPLLHRATTLVSFKETKERAHFVSSSYSEEVLEWMIKIMLPKIELTTSTAEMVEIKHRWLQLAIQRIKEQQEQRPIEEKEVSET